jgi:hypothetical protein
LVGVVEKYNRKEGNLQTCIYSSRICEEKISHGQIAEWKCYVIYTVHVGTIDVLPHQCTSQYNAHDIPKLPHDGTHAGFYLYHVCRIAKCVGSLSHQFHNENLPLNAEGLARIQTSQFWICGGQFGAWAVFCPSYPFSAVTTIPPLFHNRSYITYTI